MTDPGLTKHLLAYVVPALDRVEEADCLEEIGRSGDIADVRETVTEVLGELQESYPEASLAKPFGGERDGDT